MEAKSVLGPIVNSIQVNLGRWTEVNLLPETWVRCGPGTLTKKTMGQPANNPGTTESVLFPNRREMKMIDLSWDSIRQSQETDVTLQKIFELLRDSDAPAEVN